MAKYQGINMLRKGRTRCLTNSELARGYFFDSTDKQVLKLKKLKPVINGEKLGELKIDKYGRIVLGKKIIRAIGRSPVRIRLSDDALLINF